MAREQEERETQDVQHRVADAMELARKSAGISKAEVLRRMRLNSPSQLDGYLAGKVGVSVATLDRFATAVETPVEQILRNARVLAASDEEAVEAVINSDPRLTADARIILISAYRAAVDESERRRSGLGRRLS